MVQKPAVNPESAWPAWTGFVWFLLMAAWGLQLLRNFVWPILFFALHLIGPALADVFLLAAATVATIVLALGVDRPAALLLTPYLGWVGFAGVLNEAFLRLN